ncbi:MAG: hypothetical protein JXA51_00345 [Dehalococcoidales bacterium]|nr:hypothetical protein [Dehalococcoidales bacterium]
MTNISLVRTRDRTEGVRKAVALLGVNPVKGKSVVLKPNFNTADPAPGSTHNDTLRSLITILKEMGASRITLSGAQRPRRYHPPHHGNQGSPAHGEGTRF